MSAAPFVEVDAPSPPYFTPPMSVGKMLLADGPCLFCMPSAVDAAHVTEERPGRFFRFADVVHVIEFDDCCPWTGIGGVKPQVQANRLRPV